MSNKILIKIEDLRKEAHLINDITDKYSKPIHELDIALMKAQECLEYVHKDIDEYKR